MLFKGLSVKTIIGGTSTETDWTLDLKYVELNV